MLFVTGRQMSQRDDLTIEKSKFPEPVVKAMQCCVQSKVAFLHVASIKCSSWLVVCAYNISPTIYSLRWYQYSAHM